MTGRQLIDELVEMHGDDFDIPVMEGFDDAIIGPMTRLGQKSPVAAYDRRKVLQILMDKDGMTRAEAQEFHEFNQVGLFTPNVWCFIDTPDLEAQEHVPGPVQGESGEDSSPTAVCGATGEVLQSGAGS